MFKFLLNWDNAFYRTSPLWAIVLGFSAIYHSYAGDMWLTLFYTALAAWYSYRSLIASEVIARNNKMMNELNGKSPIDNLVSDNLIAYSIIGHWEKLEAIYTDSSRPEIMQIREREIRTILSTATSGNIEEYFEIKVYTPLGQNEEVHTEIIPLNHIAKSFLVNLAKQMNNSLIDVNIKQKIVSEE